MKTFKTFFEDNYIKYIDPKTRKEVKRRVSDTFINSIVNQQTDKDDKTSHLLDSASYLKKILKHGQDTGVFADDDKITDREVLIFFEFIKGAVPRNHLHNFLKELPRRELQKRFKVELSKSIQFSFTDILDTTCDPACAFADSLLKNELVLKVRPASDRYSARGAAGPGEAFLAFMFSGKKPEGAGDLVLGDTYVELKATGGRIGKSLDLNKSALLKSFYPRGVSSTTKEMYLDIVEYFKNHDADGDQIPPREEKDIFMWEFLLAVAGVERLDKIDMNYFSSKPITELLKYPTYRELIQLIGPVQMKDYFTKIQHFDILAIFEGQRIIGFDKGVLMKKSSEEIKNMFIANNVEVAAKSERGKAYDNSGLAIKIK